MSFKAELKSAAAATRSSVVAGLSCGHAAVLIKRRHAKTIERAFMGDSRSLLIKMLNGLGLTRAGAPKEVSQSGPTSRRHGAFALIRLHPLPILTRERHDAKQWFALLARVGPDSVCFRRTVDVCSGIWPN